MSINVDNKLPDIFVNPSQFESSLLNIIINARNAMPDGGVIGINAEIMNASKLQKIIHHKNNNITNECVSVCIKDDGIGMSDDVLAHAIEPFYTTRINQGTGLGLSMVYGFLKQSGGELIIKSQPEKGTAIYMLFPICDGKALERTKTDAAKILHNKQITILIVEDRHTVRQFAVRCLDKPGITILQANDAVTARELLKSNSVDLLLTDIVMPGDMNGHELADWASNEYPHLKILLTTAIIESDNKQSVKNTSFQLLAKPYSRSELIEAISSCLN